MKADKRITVVILEDEEHQREGLRALIEAPDIDVLCAFASTVACLDFLAKNSVDVAVVDLQLHYLGDFSEGVEAIERMRATSPATRIVVATVSFSPRRLMDCHQAGAAAFVHKPSPRETRPGWPALIRMVHAGGRYYDMHIVREIFNYVDIYRLPTRDGDRVDPADREVNPLTERQVEVLAQAAEGLSNAEIAERLTLSPQTVKNHMFQIMAKLQVEKREHAVDVARMRGYIR